VKGAVEGMGGRRGGWGVGGGGGHTVHTARDSAWKKMRVSSTVKHLDSDRINKKGE
jgi:hypothetical protein